MDLQKLNPWNWFKHEEGSQGEQQIPIKRSNNNGGLMTYSEPASLFTLQRDMDQLFDNMLNAFGMPSQRSSFPSRLMRSTPAATVFRPDIDIAGDEKNYEVSFDVPGLSEADLSIEVKGDLLTVKGQKQEVNENKDKEFYRLERSFGAFRRTLSLPDDANADAIQANLNNGVLRLQIPRQAVSNEGVKKISIS